jgi:uncharacterized protein
VSASEVVTRVADHVRSELYEDSSGHDWWHVVRVRRLARAIGELEGADLHLVELAALLHDISDYKLNGGDAERGPRVAEKLLVDFGEPPDRASAVAEIIRSVSFEGAGGTSRAKTLEAEVVQDADRLDAIGAIGIARAFAYGGYAGQLMHDPAIARQHHRTQAEYRAKRDTTTINHFHEKLLLLKDRMKTKAGRRIAERRHRVLEKFLEEFESEWNAADAAVLEPGDVAP